MARQLPPSVTIRPRPDRDPHVHVHPFTNGRTRPYDWTLDPEMRKP